MKKVNAIRALFALVAVTSFVAEARADSFYQPYYYVQREQYMTKTPGMQGDVSTPPPAPVVQTPPTYTYVPDPRLNDSTNQELSQGSYPAAPPKNVSSVAPTTKVADETMKLGTQTGAEIGLQISSYHYQEQVDNQPFMHLNGPDFGLTFKAVKAFNSGLFFGGDVRVVYGSVSYTGGDTNLLTHVTTPSKHDGETDVMVEPRIFIGQDFFLSKYVSASPYLGFGFRYLYNDATGLDSNGVSGYRRYSQYIYFPVGITPRFRIDDFSRLSLNTEFDKLLYGWQVSGIGDAIPGATQINNKQYGGYGLRGSLMYERTSWSFGPFFNYWNIDHSNVQCDNYFCGDEPHNETIEYGLEAKYRF